MFMISFRLGYGLVLGAAVTAAGAGISIAHANGPIPAAVPTSVGGSSTLPLYAANDAGSGPALYGYSRGGVGIIGKTKFAGVTGAATDAGVVGLDISAAGTTNNGDLGMTGSGGFGVRGI